VGAENFRDGVFLFFMLVKLSPERALFVVKTVSWDSDYAYRYEII